MGGGIGWFRCGFRFGTTELQPVSVRTSGPVLVLRPSWSSVATVGAGGVTLHGALQGTLPPDYLDVLLSETHLLLRRGKQALEAWEIHKAPGLDGKPIWQREFSQDKADTGLQVQKLVLGHEHVLLLDLKGAIFTWGSGRHGQLGHGDLESLLEPRRVEALHGMPLGDVAAGGWHSTCISETGDLYIWGWNEAGQLGLPAKGGAQSSAAGGGASELNMERPNDPEGTIISIQAFPALLDLPYGAEVSKVSCGSRHTAVVTRDGDLYTWGWGKYGQLGHTDTASSDQPKDVRFFVERGLYVVDVVCGPWTTYICATPTSPAGSSITRLEASYPTVEGPPSRPQHSLDLS